MAFDLSSGFDALTLRSGLNSRDFTLFTSLPIELRLKIIDHALPTHRTFEVTADVLVADPAFGLYLIFGIVPPDVGNPQFPFFSGGVTKAPVGWYTEARSLDLLLVSKEIRNYYIEKFPCSLPTSGSMFHRAAGQIRFSAQESIEITNFSQLVEDRAFRQATEENWRFQKFFNEIENLHIRMEYGMLGSVRILKCFPSLKLVKATFWKSFAEGNEAVQKMFIVSMNRRLTEIEEELRKWKAEQNSNYKVPVFVVEF